MKLPEVQYQARRIIGWAPNSQSRPISFLLQLAFVGAPNPAAVFTMSAVAVVALLLTVGTPPWVTSPWTSTHNPGPPFPGGGVAMWGSWVGCNDCGGIALLSRVWPILGCENDSSPEYLEQACSNSLSVRESHTQVGRTYWPVDGRSHGYCVDNAMSQAAFPICR